MKSTHSFRFVPLQFSFLLFVCVVQAQTLINGQLFTKALAIVNAPAINSQINAGGPISLSVDVSGNGKIQSLEGTSLDSLGVFLVSNNVNLNLTVTAGTGFLLGEPGSTVKHLDWPIPSCLPEGPYNLTFYESGRVDGTGYYSITPVILAIRNSNPSAPCTENVNPVLLQLQADSPPEVNPLLTTTTRPLTTAASQTTLQSSATTAGATVIPATTTAGSSAVSSTTDHPTANPSPEDTSLFVRINASTADFGVHWTLPVLLFALHMLLFSLS